MISRRNIRIKVMQVFYSKESADKVSFQQDKLLLYSKKEALDQYAFLLKMFESTIEYFTIFWVHFFRYLHDHSEQYVGDMSFSVYDKFYQSSFFNSYRKSAIYRSAHKNAFSHIDPVWVEKLYHPLALSVMETAYYKNYMQSIDGTPSEMEVVSYLWRKRMANASQWTDYIEDYLPYADCDDEMITAIIDDLMMAASQSSPVYVSKEAKLFGEELLSTFFDKKSVIDKLLDKHLQHWDKKRLARIDRIAIQLGITEMLFFSDIPSTVVINEYVDIVKMYSDIPSGAFINGVLDAVKKEAVSSS